MCEKNQTGKLPLSVIDHANRHLINFRALADLLNSVDPIELESTTMEGTSLIITDCTEAIHQILTAEQPDNREASE